MDWFRSRFFFNYCSHTSPRGAVATDRGTRKIEFAEHRALVGSFRGMQELDPDVKALFYMFSCNYSNSSDPDLPIHPGSVVEDIVKLCCLARQFRGLRGQVYCSRKDGDRATAHSIRSVLERRRHLPTIITITLHTLKHDDGTRAFIPADFPEKLSFDSPNMVLYSDVSRLLSAASNTAPLAFLIESCYSDNIMGLPFRCSVVCVDGERQLKWEETRVRDDHAWDLIPLRVQLAATMPENRAATFENIGSVYTRALYNAWRSPFKSMMISIQEEMDLILKGKEQQQHAVYSSQIIPDGTIIWSALGLEMEPLSN